MFKGDKIVIGVHRLGVFEYEFTIKLSDNEIHCGFGLLVGEECKSIAIMRAMYLMIPYLRIAFAMALLAKVGIFKQMYFRFDMLNNPQCQ